MNKYLLFFVLASALLILSVVTICLAPIINGAGEFFTDWNKGNCQKLDDVYKYKKDKRLYLTDDEETIAKRKIDECKRHKVMHGLEFASLTADIVLGFICTLLGLIHYVEQGKSFESTSGLIGIASGVIATVLTVIYVIYSGIILNNETIRDNDYYNGIQILYSNQAYLSWDGSKYVHNYNEQNLIKDSDIKYIKFKDLGKKEYNYDSEIYQLSLEDDTEEKNCQDNNYTPLSIQKTYNTDKKCKYIWKQTLNIETKNKFLYDRWLTTIIFSVLICLCGIGVAIFGFLLFKGNSSS